jgi:hypothetical protein
MKASLCLLITLFSMGVFAQAKYSAMSADFISFHENISAGERMFKNDSLLQAYAKYDNAFENYKGTVNPVHYFRAALCAIKIKEEFKALHFLEKAIVNGYEVDSAKEADVAFFNQNTKKEYHTSIKSWEEKRDAVKDFDWTNQLYAANDANKKYAALKYTAALEYCTSCMKNKACSKVSQDYVSKYRLVKEKMKSDSVTAVALLAKIQQSGFPSMKLVSKTACGIARNILLNYDADKKNERLDGILVRAMIEGNISPEFYATLVDRRNLMDGQVPEFYQPLTGYEKSIGKEITAANKKRNSIGLYPIKLVSTATPKKDPKAPKTAEKGLYDY